MSAQKKPVSRTASARRAAEYPYRAPQLRRIREAYTNFYLSRRDYLKRLKKENLESTVVVPPLARYLTTLEECTLWELGNIARDIEYKAREMAQRYETLMKGFTEELEKKHREEFESWEKTTVYNCGGHLQEEERPVKCENGSGEMDERTDLEEAADRLERLTKEVTKLRLDYKAMCEDSAMEKPPPAE